MKKPFDPNAILKKLADEPGKAGDFVIARDGSWWHKGGRIERKRLVALFASILHRQPDGRHWLITPYEQHEVEVEDAALHVVAVEPAADGIEARAQTDETCMIDAGHGLTMRDRDGAQVPYMRWKRGLDALVQRAAFYELVDLGEIADGHLFIRSGAARFDLGGIE